MKRVNLILVAVLAIVGASVYSYSQPNPGSGTIMYGQYNPAASPTLAPGGSYPLRVDAYGNLILSNNGGGGSISPGTNAFLVNPENIIPAGTGQIFYTECGTAYNPNGASGDSNNGLTPAAPFLTLTHALSQVTTAKNSVIVIIPHNSPNFDATDTCVETVAVTKANVSFVCGRPMDAAPTGGISCTIIAPSSPSTAAAMTVDAYAVSLHGLLLTAANDASTLVLGGSANAYAFQADGVEVDGVGGGVKATVDVGAVGDTSGVFTNSAIRYGGSDGGFIIHAAAPNGNDGWHFENDIFGQNSGCDVNGSPSSTGRLMVLTHNQFKDADKACYVNLPNAFPFYGTSGSVVDHNTFAVTTGTLTQAQLVLPTPSYGAASALNSPSGVVGSVIPPTTNTLISSHITTAAAQNIFTASGDMDINDIALTTNATGLAGGTNFVLSTDNTFGALTLCSQAVSGLGANVSVKCSAASVTTLKPFRLLSGKHILATCSVGNCTGAGTITVTPIATRATPYASFTNVALP